MVYKYRPHAWLPLNSTVPTKILTLPVALALRYVDAACEGDDRERKIENTEPGLSRLPAAGGAGWVLLSVQVAGHWTNSGEVKSGKGLLG